MKALILASALIFSANSFALTTLRIPLMSEEGVSVEKINKKLAAKGLKTLPAYFEITSKDKDAYKKYEAMAGRFSKATAAIGEEQSMASEVIPNSDMKGTCYTGTGGEPVVDLVFALAGSFYTEQMNLWGFKYKSTTKIDERALENEEEPGEMARFLNKESKPWKEWRGQGEAVLMVIAYTDDGNDVNDVIIPKCK
ncbi:MAG: hypothetical protein WC635_11445 [Bacteriovorax sp.]|jgi:hypothetical protein